jgi:hypothetical protein
VLQLYNKTPFVADLAILPDMEGVDSAILTIKATFETLAEGIRVSANQSPIISSDEYWGDPGNSSLKYAGEMTLPKPATDIVMIGHAYAPKGKPVKSEYVSVRVGRYGKMVRVFGDRYWKSALGIHTISEPKPFIKIPLIYEKAYGGVDVHRSQKSKIEYEAGNPVGTGFKIRGGKNDIDSLKLPNLEDPKNLISSRRDRPPPAGFGYIAPTWDPRKKLVGSYDEEWQKSRAPYLPDDFDSRFFNCAHPDLITNEYLQGGEEVIIQNANPSGIIKYYLPAIRFEVIFFIDDRKTVHYPHLDTLIIEPDNNQFMMIWRVCERCDKKALKIQEIDIHAVQSDVDLKGNNEK